jgi:hypothetical protein
VGPSQPAQDPANTHERACESPAKAIHASQVPSAPPTQLKMATKKTHGKSQSDRPIIDELVVELREKAGAGVDVEEIERRRGGRPPMGSAPASVEWVRLDPELRQALLDGGDQGTRRPRR